MPICGPTPSFIIYFGETAGKIFIVGKLLYDDPTVGIYTA
jgi:hypothetical protein